ncbi:MAG: RodZ domain-containing protein [Dongiaceae bacterium]
MPLDLGVGEILREARERHGQELQSVANQLRIRLVYLQAIEDGRFRDLPGSTYAVGFVRSYADYLGLDSADIVRRFREEVAKVHGQTRLIFPAVTAEGKIPGAAVLLLSVLGAVIVYGAWYYVSSRQDADLQLIPEVPDRLIALPPGEAATDGSTPALSAAGDATDSAIAQSPPSDEPPAAEVLPPENDDLMADDSPVDVPAQPAEAPVADTGPPALQPETVTDSTNAAPTATIGETAAPPPALAAPVDEAAGLPLAPVLAAPADMVAVSPTAAEPELTTGIDAPEAPTAPLPAAPAPSTGDATVMGEPIPPASDTSGVAAAETPAAKSANEINGAIPAAPPPPAPVLEPETASQGAVLPVPGGPRIVLEARMETWIRVVDAEGARVIETTLRPGERYEVPDQAGLSLKTGNAGGLDVLVDGAKAPPLGEVGAVVDRIALDPNRLRSGSVVPN